MLIPSLGCLTSKQKWNFFLFCIWLWAVFHFFKGILGPVPRTVLHEIVTALSIVYFQCKVMLRKYTVIKQQKEAFGKPPSILPNIVDAWGKFFLVPLLLVFYLLVDQLVNMCLSYPHEYAYAGLDHSHVFLIQKCMKFMKIFYCVWTTMLMT